MSTGGPQRTDVLNLMGYHLQGDVQHDFGSIDVVYNLNGKTANTKIPGTPKLDEDAVVTYFLSGPGKAIVRDVDARKSGEIVFTVPDKTASFTQWKAPLLFQGGNANLGIIQDAGEFITRALGAKNVITFGSILDPAGKPIRADQQPVWFQPATNSAEIPLGPYGFDTSIVQSLLVSQLTAGTVNAGLRLGNGTVVDAVAMLAQPPTKAKPINQTAPGLAGFFTSIKKAENIGEELVLAGVPAQTARQIVTQYTSYFYVGKTLGDASLVAAGLPAFYANDLSASVPNPYSGIGQTAGWKSWLSGDAIPAPQALALKTGDRLNWIRAIIMNLPTIYEDQAKGERRTKQYRFFPGLADPAAVRVALLNDIGAIATDVQDRYIALQKNVLSLRKPDGTIDEARTTFAPGGTQVIQSRRTPAGSVLAGRLLGEIANALVQYDASMNVTGGVCQQVLTWLRARAQRAASLTTNDELRNYYIVTLDRANACSPQATSLFIQKGKQEAYLTSKLIVANVPTGVSVGEDWPLANSLDIALRNAFVKLNSAPDTEDATYTRLLTGTDIFNRFVSRFLPQRGGGQSGGADAPLDMTSIRETVEEVVGTVEPSTDIQTGGAFLAVRFRQLGSKDIGIEFPPVLNQFPRLAEFADYLSKHGERDMQKILLYMYDIVRRRNTDRIVDPVLLNDFMLQFQDICGVTPQTAQYVEIVNGDMNIFKPDYPLDRKAKSTPATTMFNAYTYYVNGQNASEFVDGDKVTPSVQDFKAFEQAYLAKVQGYSLRGRTVLPGVFTGTRQGGLRSRRPLYTNARTSASSGRTGHARLRRRARTRRASRVRKQSRKSQTR